MCVCVDAWVCVHVAGGRGEGDEITTASFNANLSCYMYNKKLYIYICKHILLYNYLLYMHISSQI